MVVSESLWYPASALGHSCRAADIDLVDALLRLANNLCIDYHSLLYLRVIEDIMTLNRLNLIDIEYFNFNLLAELFLLMWWANWPSAVTSHNISTSPPPLSVLLPPLLVHLQVLHQCSYHSIQLRLFPQTPAPLPASSR